MTSNKLARVIVQGFALDEVIDIAEKNLTELKAIKEEANSGKFRLK